MRIAATTTIAAAKTTTARGGRRPSNTRIRYFGTIVPARGMSHARPPFH
jgi:hypothetical protein